MANMINYKTRRYYGFFHPIMTWEHRCFDYRVGGHDSETVSDGYESEVNWSDDSHATITTTEKTHVVSYAYFKRHQEYPKNILFVLLEFFMTLVSVIRVGLCKYLIAGYIILGYVIPDLGFTEFAEQLGLAALAIYGLSIVIPLAGYIVRKVFGLDKRMDDICDENGWRRWSDYQDE